MVARYARNVFDMADTADRSNTADGQTVKAFMAAVCFMDTMNYFQKELGEAGAGLLAECKIKQQHAAYRAGVIHKALKAGTPIPPPKGESGDAVADLDSMFASLPALPGTTGGVAGGGVFGATAGLGLPPPAPAPAPYTAPAPAPYVAPAPAPAPSFVVPAASPAVTAGAVSVAQQQQAQRHAQAAAHALQVSQQASHAPRMTGPARLWLVDVIGDRGLLSEFAHWCTQYNDVPTAVAELRCALMQLGES